MKMKMKNKWNGNIYTIIEDSGSSVKLQRGDDSTFTISKSELNFNYIEISE